MTTPIIVTAVPTATISYVAAPFCSTLTSAQNVTLAGTHAYLGGLYSATPAGLSINAASGAIVPSTSSSGNYNVTYQIPASGGCASVTVSTTVKVTTNPTAAISYSGTPFCRSLTSGQAITITGTNAYTGGTYSATPAGLTINASTGSIIPSTSLAGNYTVTYQVPASGGCASFGVTTPIIVTAVPTATISYDAAPFCSTLTSAQNVTLAGTNAYLGGSYSATPAGLSINAASGAIVPSTSSTGNYNVTYQIPASGGCASVTVPTTVKVTANPTATIGYSGTPFCRSLSSGQAITITGTNAYTGGTYSATPAGLTINASTGSIIPSTSLAGNYTVTYQVPASGGCASFGVTTPIIVTAVPTATISYDAAPFCSTLTSAQNVTLAGTNAYLGGSYSATPAGLSINAASGAIVPSTSTPGNYNVTYQIPASGGCASVTVPTTVKVTANPTATIGYSGTPFCRSLSSGQAITITGTNAYTGGTYCATPAGLTINASTGSIIPSTSSAGNYTVTYQVPAGGGCASFGVTTPIIVTAVPTATISYAAAPFCSTLTSAQNVTLAGTHAYLGGSYSATPAGLSINAASGVILPSTSVVNSYMVTYTIPASGGCASSITTAPIIIKPTPVLSATPSAVNLCSGDTTSIALNSSVTATTFDWTTAQVNVNGVQNGAGNLISQLLTTSGNRAGTAVYTVTPTADGCVGAPLSILVRVNPLPLPVLYDGVICINELTNQVARIYTLNAGLSDADYDFGWTFNNNPITNANGYLYEATQTGTYGVVATNMTTGCVSFPVTAQVTATYAAQAMVTYGYEAFTETPMVVVNVSGSGQYLYQLDDGPQQSSNVFYNVSLGTHTVKVADPEGCTNLMETITVIGYPKYFTPNNDGYHDTWNIIGFPDNQPAVIYIFDRYGKLLKQMSTLGNGWDGIYNGSELPATDYWFTIDYLEKNQQKKFGSHFSLKR